MEKTTQTSSETKLNGYVGKLLRVDLTVGESTSNNLDEAFLRKYVGGTTLGIKLIYDEVLPGTDWSDPANRIYFGSGPLGGTRIGGSGEIAVVTKGAMTNGMASSQAAGFFGAFLRMCGYDYLILQGAAADWVYLHIYGDGTVQIKDGRHLIGKSTIETEDSLRQELHKGEHEVSILSIGVAGENKVRFACTVSDGGHVAAHNGIGAVMGSKKVKAIVVERGKTPIPLKDPAALSQTAKDILAMVEADKMGSIARKGGTLAFTIGASQGGSMPVKNYTTNIHIIDADKLDAYSSPNIRTNFKAKPNPCWACSSKHCHKMEVPNGKYAGRIFEEPEYEGVAAFSGLVGIDDMAMTILLASEVDRLGIDTNEAGWVIAWVIECFEKKILTTKETDGLEMRWGNGEAIMAMLNKIAYRQGFGDILAEGVMRAAKQVGGQAPYFAVHTLKGNTPRSHDHRVSWFEMFDTCVSNLGTLEAHSGAPYKLLGLPEIYEKFDAEVISAMVAKTKGAMLFEDTVITCRYNTLTRLDLLCQAVNAATGWNMDVQEAMTVGKRAVNIARAFNLRNGIGPELDAPSMRYGSTPLDGNAAGKGIMCNWNKMLSNYYTLMGWDIKTGRPLPETLRLLSLDFVIPQLW